MSLQKYAVRLKRMDDLIRRKATGTPDEFANKLGICKSTLMIYLNEIKELGGPVKYSAQHESYFYETDCKLEIGYHILDEMQHNSIKGGREFTHSNNIRMGLYSFAPQAFEC